MNMIVVDHRHSFIKTKLGDDDGLEKFYDTKTYKQKSFNHISSSRLKPKIFLKYFSSSSGVFPSLFFRTNCTTVWSTLHHFLLKIILFIFIMFFSSCLVTIFKQFIVSSLIFTDFLNNIQSQVILTSDWSTQTNTY